MDLGPMFSDSVSGLGKGAHERYVASRADVVDMDTTLPCSPHLSLKSHGPTVANIFTRLQSG